MVQQSRRETRTPEPDFTNPSSPPAHERERARTRTLARALTQAHLTVTDVATVIEHARPDDNNPYPDRCAAWRMECTADGHPLTIRYDWLTPTPHLPWTGTVHGTTHRLPDSKGRYFTGTAQRLAPVIRALVRTTTN
ncbi:hypothetical protein OG883_45790 [Streptomyces sp. NBC_01142]|uniref:hypothetical protein n=1 Tax=Streptomyces sp. NBC_01142 TaxID=2975865 RepID=UPI00224F3AFC|nr:hypothetical protein [Streptomyces sp. NBC_01142]MCX4826953.1 hypothetical protein [Streptomyces sp. NBC_01142]